MTEAIPPSSGPSAKEAMYALNIVSAIHRLTLKAFEADNRNMLAFLILNDTIGVIKYDRAVLWDLERTPPKLLGVSGQSTINASTEIAKKWRRFVGKIKHFDTPQIVEESQLIEEQPLWQEYVSTNLKPSVLWYPIVIDGKPRLGLWLERWDQPWTPHDVDIMKSLIAGYAMAWKKFRPKASSGLKQMLKWLMIIGIPLLLFGVHLPLRIVAPCEVVPKDPILITAPLEDIIQEVKVKPGQIVKKGDILAEYDKRVALQSLRIAQEQLKVAQEDLTRARTLAFRDEKSLAEIAVLEAKVKKELASLDLAKYRASRLLVKSPEPGIAMLENPDEWRGKPVRVGEKILMVIDPEKTKVRMWIPENDNVELNFQQPVKVFLNVTPTIDRPAKLNFISNASMVTEKNVVSFMAEADWIDEQKDVSPGLKGTALLYGEKVTLFYWLVRKPWNTFRVWTGI